MRIFLQNKISHLLLLRIALLAQRALQALRDVEAVAQDNCLVLRHDPARFSPHQA